LFSYNYELIPILPRLHTLKQLLSKRFYTRKEFQRSSKQSKKRSRDRDSASDNDDDLTDKSNLNSNQDNNKSDDMDDGPSNERNTSDINDDSINLSSGQEKDLYSFNDLRHIVQASDQELQVGLRAIGAVLIDGYFRLIHADYVADVNDLIFNLIAMHNWPLDRLPVRQMCNIIVTEDKMASSDVVKTCLLMLMDPVAAQGIAIDSFGSTDETTCALDHGKVSCFRALQMLTNKNPYQIDAFLEEWKVQVPLGVEPKLEMLKGISFFVCVVFVANICKDCQVFLCFCTC
jgi:hypothetical protein